jgi:hypothetical protein
MATNANPYVVNIVPLQGIATGLTSSSDTASQITAIQTNVANLQTMINPITGTLSADYIQSFTQGNTIQVLNSLNLSSASLYKDNVLTTSGSESISSITNTNSYISVESNKISFVTAGNDVLQITPTGNLQYISPSIYLSSGVDINGYLYVSENAYIKTVYQTSDRNQKTNITPFVTSLDKILELKPYTFNWIDSGEPDLGFIAQDVSASWPSLTMDGTSIAYSRFVPLLLEGLRELNSRVSTLEGLRT